MYNSWQVNRLPLTHSSVSMRTHSHKEFVDTLPERPTSGAPTSLSNKNSNPKRHEPLFPSPACNEERENNIRSHRYTCTVYAQNFPRIHLYFRRVRTWRVEKLIKIVNSREREKKWSTLFRDRRSTEAIMNFILRNCNVVVCLFIFSSLLFLTSDSPSREPTHTHTHTRYGQR